MCRLFPRIDFSFPTDYNPLQGSERLYVFVSATPINRASDRVSTGTKDLSCTEGSGFWRREMRSWCGNTVLPSFWFGLSSPGRNASITNLFC